MPSPTATIHSDPTASFILRHNDRTLEPTPSGPPQSQSPKHHTIFSAPNARDAYLKGKAKKIGRTHAVKRMRYIMSRHRVSQGVATVRRGDEFRLSSNWTKKKYYPSGSISETKRVHSAHVSRRILAEASIGRDRACPPPESVPLNWSRSCRA